MRLLGARSLVFFALAGGFAVACGDTQRTFINGHVVGEGGDTSSGATGGVGGKGGKGGTAGSGVGGTSATGGIGGSAGSSGKGGKGGTSGIGGSGGDAGAGEGGQAAGTGGVGGSVGGAGGKGGSAGDAGNGGEAGQVIIVPPEAGLPGTALVPGGRVMKSASYTLVSVTSQGVLPTQAKSAHFILHGTVVGAPEPAPTP